MRTTAFVGLTAASAAMAQVPDRMGYQGRLFNPDGTPASGVVQMRFALYDSLDAGSAVGCDKVAVALTDGFYSVHFGGMGGCAGTTPAIQASAFDGRDLWLELAIGGNTMSPRQRIGTVAYAFKAGAATNVRGGTVEATSVQVGGPSGLSISGIGIALGTATVIDATGRASVATGAGLTGDGTSAKPVAVAVDGVTGAMLASDTASLAKASGGAMTATAGLSVGIGTATPGRRLEVAGDVNVIAGDAKAYRIDNTGVLYKSGASTLITNLLGAGGEWRIRNAADNASLLVIQDGGGATQLSVLGSDAQYGAVIFGSASTNNLGSINGYFNGGSPYLAWFVSGTEKMRVTNSGDVGVGTSTPGARLDVGGSVRPGADAGGCSAAKVGAIRLDTVNGLQSCVSNKDSAGLPAYTWAAALPKPVIWSGGCPSHSQGAGWATYCLSGVDFNSAVDYLNVDAGGTVTVKISGYYRLNMWADQHGCGHKRVNLVVNGTSRHYSHMYNTVTGWQLNRGDLVYPLRRGDTFYFQLHHDGGCDPYRWHAWNNLGQHSRLQIEYVGPQD